MRLAKKFGTNLVKLERFQSSLSTPGSLYGNRRSIRLLSPGGSLKVMVSMKTALKCLVMLVGLCSDTWKDKEALRKYRFGEDYFTSNDWIYTDEHCSVILGSFRAFEVNSSFLIISLTEEAIKQGKGKQDNNTELSKISYDSESSRKKERSQFIKLKHWMRKTESFMLDWYTILMYNERK